jgi:hypothetical protein
MRRPGVRRSYPASRRYHHRAGRRRSTNGARRSRLNGEGSIFPYRNGFAAYVWVNKPDGKRGRKWVYGKTREEVHDKWIRLHHQAKNGPVATRVPTIGAYVTNWLAEVVKPNRALLTYATYETFTRLYIVPGLGSKRLLRWRKRLVLTLSEPCRLEFSSVASVPAASLVG